MIKNKSIFITLIVFLILFFAPLFITRNAPHQGGFRQLGFPLIVFKYGSVDFNGKYPSNFSYVNLIGDILLLLLAMFTGSFIFKNKGE